MEEMSVEGIHVDTVPPPTLPAVAAAKVLLVRHGEVLNPHRVVYADLPGYGLSARGAAQAAATADHVATAPVAAVVSSPLLRARQTAQAIAKPHGIEVELDADLTEWGGGIRWAGVVWDDIDKVFPGELTAYLNTPLDLPFAPESLADCGRRVALSVQRRAALIEGAGVLVVVGHQDPIQAGRLTLTGRWGEPFHDNKPAHAAIVTLMPDGERWAEGAYWEPDQGGR